MIKANILYGQHGQPFNTNWQEKSFKDENSAVEWCRRNYNKIGCINDYRTGFELISHFEIIDALRGISN